MKKVYMKYIDLIHPLKCKLPETIQLEVTSICNFSCPRCPTRMIPQNEKGHMSMETFNRIIHLIPKIKLVCAFGCGEPLMNPHFLDMIKIIHMRGGKALFQTNGSLLTKPIMEEIVKHEAEVVFSVDGATPETGRIIRPQADFECVLEKIRTLDRLRHQYKSSTKIKICCTVWQENLEEVPALVDLAHSLNVDGIHIQNAFHYTPESFKKSIHHLGFKYVQSIFTIAKNKTVKYGMEYRFPSFMERTVCPFPWTSSYVNYDGAVIPCCYVQHSFPRYDHIKHGKIIYSKIQVDPFSFVLGNVNELPFKDIWNGEKYREFRARLRSQNLPVICEGCPARHGMH